MTGVPGVTGVIPRLAGEASGLRHLRWAREVLGSLEAHHEHDGRLRQADRDLVIEEAVKLRALVNELPTTVKVYRDFLERARTRFRGMLRVGRYLVQEARGRRHHRGRQRRPRRRRGGRAGEVITPGHVP